MSNLATATVTQGYQNTQDWKDIYQRYETCKKENKTSLLVLEPAHEKSFGGWGIAGEVKDAYGNLVLNTINREDRLGIGAVGAVLAYDKLEDLRFIYALLHCPMLRNVLQMPGEPFERMRHRFKVTDAEKESKAYADKMEEDIKYKNKIYQVNEGFVNLLCIITGVNTESSLGVKRADLCRVWDSGGDAANNSAMFLKKKLKEMIDSPDADYYQTAYEGLKLGNAQEGKGFYKTQSGVYKHNEEVLGNSIDHVVAYLKNNDEVYTALRKNDTTNNTKPVKKPN